MNRSITSNFPEDATDYFPPQARGKVPLPKHARRSSDLDSSEYEGTGGAGTLDRRMSMSSNSSHEPDRDFSSRHRLQELGLVQLDPVTVPFWAASPLMDEEEGGASGANGNGNGRNEAAPVYMWTANNGYAMVMRISFKKRISAVWLEAYALKQYVELNLTAFEKILKKWVEFTHACQEIGGRTNAGQVRQEHWVKGSC
jgi:phosphate transporter